MVPKAKTAIGKCKARVINSVLIREWLTQINGYIDYFCSPNNEQSEERADGLCFPEGHNVPVNEHKNGLNLRSVGVFDLINT